MSHTFILFRAGGDVFALPGKEVMEVVPGGVVTPLPFVPDFVEGVVTVGGQIIPQIDFARRLGRPAGTGRDLMVIRSDHGPFALRIDHAVTMLTLEDEQYHPVRPEDGPVLAVVGEFAWEERSVLVLDPARLGIEGVEPVDVPAGGGGLIADGRGRLVGPVRADDGFAGIVVQVEGERYALPLTQVREIVEIDQVRTLPQAPVGLVGLFNLRGRPLVLLSLARLLGADHGADARTAILADGPDGPLALLVDRVLGLRRFALTPHKAQGDLGALVDRYVIDSDDRIVMILEPQALGRHPSYAACRGFMTGAKAAAAPVEMVATRRFLALGLSGEIWAMDLAKVDRVSEYRTPMPVPATLDGAGVDGIIDIGGDILPMIDLRRRLAASDPESDGAFVITRLPGGNAALLVDRLHRIIDLPVTQIELFADGRADLVAGVGRLEDRLVSILAVDHLLAGQGAS